MLRFHGGIRVPGERTSDIEVQSSAAFLRQVALFADLTDAQRSAVAAASTLVRVPAGAWLFREGDAGDALYVVRTGRLEVMRGDIIIRVLGAGAALGELALLTESERSASVRARRETEVLRLGRDDFAALLTDPAFAVALTRTLGEQLQKTAVAAPVVGRSSRVITVVPLARAMAPLARRLAESLRETLVGLGLKTELLRGVEVDASGDMDFDEGTYGRLLDRCERVNDHVLLLAEGSDDPEWDKFCLRQADRVVGVVDPAAGAPGPRQPKVTDLVFLNRVPRSAYVLPWLDSLRPDAYHQLDGGTRFDLGAGRIGRRLAGRSVGLVLSGGGARGLAHIGVLKALAESGMPIDRFGGTSMGSFVAGLAAMDMSVDEMVAAAREELAERKPFGDYTIPRHALIKARRAELMLQRVFGHRRVEELERPWFAVSADLLTGEEVIHTRGPVAVGVGTSMCLPGLVPPVAAGDKLLVDGGVLNNLPVDIMAATGEGPVLAVDVMRKPQAGQGKPVRSRGANKPSPFGMFSADSVLPSLVDTLARSTVLGSTRRAEANRAAAALVINPELGDVGLLEWRRIDAIVDRGYAAASAALADFKP
jgi:NTE family protein